MLCASLVASPAGAQQDDADKNVQVMITQQRDTYSAPPAPTPQPCQDERSSSDIVVCGRENGDKYRIQQNSTSTDTGVPHADVGTHPPPGQVNVRGCFLQKCPRQLYLIDLKSIPLPPEGSDADKIAKGEMRAP